MTIKVTSGRVDVEGFLALPDSSILKEPFIMTLTVKILSGRVDVEGFIVN